MPRYSRLSRLRKHKYAVSFRPASLELTFYGSTGDQARFGSYPWYTSAVEAEVPLNWGNEREVRFGPLPKSHTVAKCCSEMWPAELARSPSTRGTHVFKNGS
jgi:hypothetical protein